MKSAAARVTTAAEGLSRRRFTVAEVEAMVAAGVMEEDERVELIGGDWFRCRPRETSTRSSRPPCRSLVSAAPDDVDLAPATTFRLSEDTYLEPDVVIYPRASGIRGLRRRMAARGRDRGFVAATNGPQGGALRQLRHPRTLGHRRGQS